MEEGNSEIQQREFNSLNREEDFCSASQRRKGRERERERRVRLCYRPGETTRPPPRWGLKILWGRHGAGTEGRKVQERTNTRSEFLAAPGDNDSFW